MREATLIYQKTDSDNKSLTDYCDELRRTFKVRRKLLLVQAPQFLFDTINVDVIRNRGYYAFPPTGLQWLKKSVTERGIHTDIFDLNFHLLHRIINDPDFDYHDWLGILDDCLDSTEPSVVGVTCLSVYTDLLGTYHPLTVILDHLMQKKKYVVVAGGPTAVNEIRGYIGSKFCHFLIEGEGEDRLNYLFNALFDEDRSHSPVRGIYFNLDGNVQETAGETKSVRLAGNLIDTHEDIPVEKYCGVGCLNPFSRMSGQDRIYSVLQLHRGCRANCKFCGVRSFMGKGIRTHPVEEVVMEIRYLVEERGVRHFDVLDDDFLADVDAVSVLLREMACLRSKYKITWSASNGLVATGITKELLDLMHDSGCSGFRIGFESGDIDMLHRIRKPGTPKLFQKVCGMLQDYPGFFVGGNFIIGLFGEETFKQMLHTFTFSCRLNIDWAAIAVFQNTSKPEIIAENLKTGGKKTGNFIPVKDTATRDIQDERALPLGPDIFLLPPDEVPSNEQINNVWFTFNLISNYINNKNLKSGGNPKKYVAWVEALQITYPTNPYMYLFAGLGQVLSGNMDAAQAGFMKAENIVNESEIWNYRFKQFGIDSLLERFPQSEQEVYERLEAIQGQYKEYF